MEIDDTALSIAGVILAAGSASRMGRPKLLLPWRGEALIRHVVHVAVSYLNPIVVVTGAWAKEIQDVLLGLPVQIVHNPEWADGQSTSVRKGIKALPQQTSAALFLLGDQPYVSTELIQNLLNVYAQTRPVVLAPYVGEKRSNPVLFDRSIFNELCRLRGDTGARSIFARYPPKPFIWPDERLLFDIDTPEDYQKLIRSE